MLDIPARLALDKAAFLDWAEGREGRCELVEGRVEMMVGASRAHGLITRNIVMALMARVDRQQWTVLADFGVDVGPDTLRYPDVVVERVGGSPKGYTTAAPVLACEVLSPSTATTDLGDKAAEYLSLSSLLGYAVFSQNECKAWTWVRGEAGFAPGPQVVTGREAIIGLHPALGLNLPLADVYADIDFA